MKMINSHLKFALGLVMVIVLVAAGCTPKTTPVTVATERPTENAGVVPPITVQQPSMPDMAGVQPPAQDSSGLAAPAPGPNLLAKNWSERLGIIVSEFVPPTGTPILQPKAGDLWFFSNSSTTWGATNTKNAVWVIDAKTKKTVAEIAPADGEGSSSHGIAVSGDGSFIYLPMLGKDNHIDVLDGRTLEVVQRITTLGRPHHQKLWHDPVTNKDYIIGEDFNWNWTGSGFYVIDPSQQNAVVGGLSNGDFEGNPYVSAPAPDGTFIIMTVPAPNPAFRDKMDGWVAKIDPTTWKVVGMTPMVDPLYPIVSLDGKFAYVTSGGEARVYKIDTATMEIVGEVQTGPGPWGAALSYDQTKLYTADKGEGPGYNQLGHTSTVVDLQTMGVVDVFDIGVTTDHALTSPDGKEIWYTSNAEHGIYVLDVATNTVSFIKDPADGDIHGGVWVQYKDDGKGGVIGEVVSDYGGLHGSALAAEIQYVSEPTLTIAIGRNGFLQKELKVQAGQSVRVIVKNVAGTSAGNITFESADMGIESLSLSTGEEKEIRWTAPSQPISFTATTNKKPGDTLTITVEAPPTPAPTTVSAASGSTNVTINAKGFAFDIKELVVSPGQTIHFTLINSDDEKHNLVGLGEGLSLLSPDVSAGQTITYDWVVPDRPGTYQIICAYHPTMIITLTIK